MWASPLHPPHITASSAPIESMAEASTWRCLTAAMRASPRSNVGSQIVALTRSRSACCLCFAASGDESHDRGEERLGLPGLFQACPPCGRLAGAELTSLYGPVDCPLVEPLVEGEPGRST